MVSTRTRRSAAKWLVRGLLLTLVLVILSRSLFGVGNESPSNTRPTTETERRKQYYVPQEQEESLKQEEEAVLVVASLKKDETSWLDIVTSKRNWGKRIYIVDAKRNSERINSLRVPINKGREAMVYLTYIIDNYSSLPSVSIFIHSQRYQWHNDDPNYDGLPPLLSLKIPFIHAQNYTNLRVTHHLGCPVEIKPLPLGAPIPPPPKEGDHERAKKLSETYYAPTFSLFFPTRPVPTKVGVSCCAQFAVSRTAILSHPVTFYTRVREWLLTTELADDVSGRILEYMWHIIFGRESEWCPDEGAMYCEVFGWCGAGGGTVKVGEGEDVEWVERYILPPFSTLPDGWPFIGWKGEKRTPVPVEVLVEH
ncbi:MAG: hypothetical protein MMC33_001905 [Icmadophila ericetorum]|nr:hypothetical protein [Icmadophila ericetorum]